MEHKTNLNTQLELKNSSFFNKQLFQSLSQVYEVFKT